MTDFRSKSPSEDAEIEGHGFDLDNDGEPDPIMDPLHALTDAARKAMVILEDMMLEGKSRVEVRKYAIEHLGLNVPKFNALRGLILQSWERTVLGPEHIAFQRNEIRAKMWYIYKLALEDHKTALEAQNEAAAGGFLKLALNTLDHIAELDGLNAPNQLNISVGTAAITNAHRDNVMTLMAKMKNIAEQKFITSGLQPVQLVKEVRLGEADHPGSNGHGSNGSNGSNGKRVIDIAPVDNLKTSKNTIVCLDCGEQRPRPAASTPCQGTECGSLRWRAWRDSDP